MGDDAEYYMEQQAEEASFRQACQLAAQYHNSKPLFCWTNDYFEEIWDWQPLVKVFNVFSNLYNFNKIGSDYFLCDGIPNLEYDEYLDDEDCLDDASLNEYEDSHEELSNSESENYPSKIINDLEFFIANNEDDAIYEVIVLSQNDVKSLKNEAINQKKSAKHLKEEMLAEMLEEMASYIEQNAQCNLFIFARTL